MYKKQEKKKKINKFLLLYPLLILQNQQRTKTNSKALAIEHVSSSPSSNQKA